MDCKVYFDFKHKGFHYVRLTGANPVPIGVCLKVKNATWHATWVFLPTKAFRNSFPNPYKRFCFGNSRRVAVDNFINGVHRVFQTGGAKSYLRYSTSLSAPSEEVADHG